MLEGASTPDVTGEIDVSNISDEQVDKYFESGGREIPAEVVENTSAPDGETQEKPAEQQEQAQKEEKYVNYNALHEERMKRKELSEQLKSEQARTTRLEQTFQALLRNAQQAAEPQAPSFDEDPIEALRVNQLRLERENKARDDYLSQQAQHADQQRRAQEFMGAYHNKAQEFSKTQPDFVDAYNYLSKTRLEEYLVAGHSKESAMALLHEDEAVIVSQAFKEGINPAERLYKLAKHRGWNHTQQANDGGAKGEQKMSQLEKGIQSAKSLSNVSGKSPLAANEITLEALSHMDDNELSEYISGKNWEKIAKQFR